MSIFADLLGRADTKATALLWNTGPISLGELLHDSETLAQVLRSAGLQPRDSVVLWLPMGRDLIAALLAVRSLGCVYSVLGVRSTLFEATRVLEDIGSRLLVTTRTVSYRAADLGLEYHAAWRDNIVVRHHTTVTPPMFAPDDACVIFTSGSTARPKGVVLTDRSISSNARAVAEFTCLSPLDRSVVFTQPQFAFAQSQVFSHLISGASFFPWGEGVGPHDRLWSVLTELSVTGVLANPTSYDLLLRSIGKAGTLASVRYLVSAGQPLLATLAINLRVAFPFARIASCFGCTENTLRATYFWLPLFGGELSGVLPVGRPVRGTMVTIIDERGAPVAAGEEGIVRLYGTSLMRGYLDSLRGPDDCVSAFDTDDLGYIDDCGDLHLTGRVSARLNVGNEKVSPEEVESVIAAVAGVEECAVGPLADELLGEVPAAIVAIADNTRATSLIEEVVLSCERLLSRAKRPRFVWVVDRTSIPKTEYGKLNRRELRAAIVALRQEHRG